MDDKELTGSELRTALADALRASRARVEQVIAREKDALAKAELRKSPPMTGIASAMRQTQAARKAAPAPKAPAAPAPAMPKAPAAPVEKAGTSPEGLPLAGAAIPPKMPGAGKVKLPGLTPPKPAAPAVDAGLETARKQIKGFRSIASNPTAMPGGQLVGKAEGMCKAHGAMCKACK